MAIVRWDPFREFGGAWMPPVDIYSTGEHELVIKAEIPGMNKDDIDITVENFTLTIHGEKKTEAGRQGRPVPSRGAQLRHLHAVLRAAAHGGLEQGGSLIQRRGADHQAPAA